MLKKRFRVGEEKLESVRSPKHRYLLFGLNMS